MRARAGNKIINILTICALMACSVPTFAVDAMFPLNQRGQGGYSVYSDGAPTGFASDITNSPHPASSHLLPLEKGSFSLPSTSRREVRGEVSVPTGFAVNAMFPLNQRGLGGYSVYSDGTPTGFAVDLTQTTLDSLAGQPIPNTDPVEYYPADLKSAYTLTPTDTVGTSTITKYIINDDNTLTPQYFDVNLRKTEYGEGENAIYYKWELDSDGNYKFVETINQPEARITVIYDTTNILSRISNFNRKDITGDFIGNSIQTTSTTAEGGAIYNKGRISDIIGNFIGNYALSTSSFASGGAIYSYSDDTPIGNITGDFIGNYVKSLTHGASGGAIYADYSGNTMGDITGDFIGNFAISYYNAEGGAIKSRGAENTIGDITGNFIGNYASSTSRSANGGAIDNGGTIGDITGDFIGNYTSSTSSFASSDAEGGAIYNFTGVIGDITGDFIGNYASSTSGSANGGAIYTYNWSDTIGDITGDFIGNFAIGNFGVSGGAIDNSGTIGDITGNFIGNYALSTSSLASGGAIYNYEGTIGTITGSFINNHVSGTYEAIGGAICTIAEEQAMLTGVYSYMQLTVIDDNSNPIYTVYALVDSEGNVVPIDDYKNAVINGEVDTKPVFVGSESGSLADLGMSLEEFKELANQAGYTEISPLDIYNENLPPLPPIDPSILVEFANTNTDEKEALTLRNSNIIGNHANVADGRTALGGAIYSENHNIRLLADDGNVSKISGNYTKVGDVVENNAIYLKNASLIFKTLNKSTIQVDDKINGANYDVFVTGDGESNTIFNDNISNANSIVVQKGNLYLGREDVFNNSNALYLADGNLHLINGTIGAIDMPTVNFVGETNLSVDVDLANETMDRITADTYNVANDAKLHVNHINLLSDANQDNTQILFADKEFAPIVDYTGESPIAYTPIYKYNIDYKVDEDEKGYFLFNRFSTAGSGGSTSPSNPSEAFNPSVLATPAAQQAGGQAVVTESVRFAFQHADTFTQMPMNIRMSMLNNRYAVLDGEAKYTRPYHMQNKGVWVKPFTSFESMSLKNGPKVDAVTYGTIVGFDSDFKELGRGWYGVTSAYVGYNGSMIDYANVDTTMNGGLVGLTETLYKDKFFAALTATAGANTGSSNTMYGKEDFTSLVGGIGLKTGYNFEFQEGRYIIQPIMFMNYTFVNTFDYTSASGVRIDSDPMHAFQLNPSVRFIANLKNGWQPYASVGMVWNVLNSSKVKADDIILPKMSMKPYVEYGLGLQRSWADRFTAYGQAMVRNGGRNGVMLSAGMRWSLGEDEPLDAI